MIAVIFEFEVHQTEQERYFNLAEQLKPELEKINGFISVNRFKNTETPEKLLSLSLWHDQSAVDTWKKHADHIVAQKEGKKSIFKNYNIYVTKVIQKNSFTSNTTR
ncbi:MAG: antibiotic biosynthesis monooxygenase [Magnetovibrio sp.]|nr:antibiotic biosynthesis monooxygenase [Magnetovibrio sp.]|tara:strand:- start:165 stop:482 length:318 start_codon:yes stop_codon:yes gene_type:complete